APIAGRGRRALPAHPVLDPLPTPADHRERRGACFLRDRGRPRGLVRPTARAPDRLAPLRAALDEQEPGRDPGARPARPGGRRPRRRHQGPLRPRIPRPEGEADRARARPRAGDHRQARGGPARDRQGLLLRRPPEAAHAGRRPLLRGPRLLQPAAPRLRPGGPQARQAHPPGPRPDADVRELLRPLPARRARGADDRHRALLGQERRDGQDHPTRRQRADPRCALPDVPADGGRAQGRAHARARGGRAGAAALGEQRGVMSEYQCYEFVALDRRLTSKEMAELRAISTRAEISPTRFWNEYHFGDLKADPATLLARYFDAHLYFANWGTRRFMLRLPARSVDTAAL